MTLAARRLVSLLAVLTVLVSAVGLQAWTPARAHGPMPCCQAESDCAVRLSASSCCGPMGSPATTTPSPVAVSASAQPPAAVIPGQAVVPTSGRILPSASDALGLALLQATHDPPYLLNVVLLI